MALPDIHIFFGAESGRLSFRPYYLNMDLPDVITFIDPRHEGTLLAACITHDGIFTTITFYRVATGGDVSSGRANPPVLQGPAVPPPPFNIFSISQPGLGSTPLPPGRAGRYMFPSDRPVEIRIGGILFDGSPTYHTDLDIKIPVS